jgi:hypothetical protein
MGTNYPKYTIFCIQNGEYPCYEQTDTGSLRAYRYYSRKWWQWISQTMRSKNEATLVYVFVL